MADKQTTKSNLEKLARIGRKLRVIDLLNMSSANAVLEKVAQLPGLQKVIVFAETVDGMEIYYNTDIRAVILELDMMHTRLINEFLYDDDSEEGVTDGRANR